VNETCKNKKQGQIGSTFFLLSLFQDIYGRNHHIKLKTVATAL